MPLRLEMRLYRWCLTFGEIVLNWEDLTAVTLSPKSAGWRVGEMGKLCEKRVCIVTGGARGLGRDYALMLAEHGAKVVVNDLGGTRDGAGAELGPAEEVVAEIRKAGGEAVANGADVSDFQQAKAMIQQAVDTFGRLDVLVNNAGILRDRMLVNMTEAEWDAVIKVHLRGTFAPAHHAAAYWRDQSKAGTPVDARLINTTSVSGIYGNMGQTNYGAAKAGIASFTIIAARELAALRHHRQPHRAWRAHNAIDRGPGGGRDHRPDASAAEPALGRAHRHLARELRVEGRERPHLRGVGPYSPSPRAGTVGPR